MLHSAVFGAAFAWAAFPETISVRAMDDYAGASTTYPDGEDYVTSGYKQVVRELGTAIANKPVAPGETLGVYGFHVGVGTTVAFIDTQSPDGKNPSGWVLVDPEEDADTSAPLLAIPQLHLRKGLPASLEVGANVGWIGMSQTGTLGVYGRWGILEGYKPLPDVSVQVGYAGYVGNDELEVGTFDASATIGYTLPFGTTPGINQASFSPFIGLGLNQIHGAPRGDLSRTGLEGRVPEVTGMDSANENFDATFSTFQIAGGFRILNGDFSATLSSAYTPGLLPAVNLGFGFTY